MTLRVKIFLSALSMGLIVLVHSNWLDELGLKATEDGLTRALVTFGISRGLNGVISVVQGTEVSVEPVGIGMTFTPGEILDPVNDLVERFSTIVLIAGTAFGVQRVALEVSSAELYSWITTAFIVALILVLWLRQRVPSWAVQNILKLTLVLVIVRFAVPVLVIGGDVFYQHFLEPQFTESSQQLSLTSQRLSEMQAEATTKESLPGEESLLDRARQMVRSATQSLDVQQYLESFKTAAESISENAMRLMVVFIFQTLMLPLLSIWLVLKLLKVVLSKKQFGSMGAGSPLDQSSAP